MSKEQRARLIAASTELREALSAVDAVIGSRQPGELGASGVDAHAMIERIERAHLALLEAARQ